MARGNGPNCAGLQDDRRLPQKRNLRPGTTDAARSRVGAQYIAEGKGHRSNKEFAQYLFHAGGSLWELQTQILVAEELRYVSDEQGNRLLTAAENISRALNGLITSLATAV